MLTKEENDLILTKIIKECRRLDINELEERNNKAKEQLSIETAMMTNISTAILRESQNQISLLDSIISVAKRLNCR